MINPYDYLIKSRIDGAVGIWDPRDVDIPRFGSHIQNKNKDSKVTYIDKWRRDKKEVKLFSINQ